jgi:hypothetical protein
MVMTKAPPVPVRIGDLGTPQSPALGHGLGEFNTHDVCSIPDVDFIFPDLWPEEYAETKAKLGRKKS